jgi:DNA-binding CsgD family transcriptional regulator
VSPAASRVSSESPATGGTGVRSVSMHRLRSPGTAVAGEDGDQPTVFEAAFVGRRDELDALDRALATAESGSGSVVVVHGEAGIGKTEMVAQFVRTARRVGAVALCGACSERGPARAYEPWTQAFGDRLEELNPDRLEEISGQARLRLFDAVVSMLRSMRELPVVVLDDAQWADTDALDLLVWAARHVSRLLIVVIHDGTTLDLGHPLAACLADVVRTRPHEYLLLEGLSREESAELVRESTASADLRLSDALHEEVGGNPFYLAELARHIGSHGVTRLDDSHGWRPPQTLRQAIARRLARLSVKARETLGFASLFTAGFGFAELQLLARLDEDQLLDALDEALAAELIRPSGSDRYDFAHALVRRAIRDGFSPSRRARLHRGLAEILERTLEATPEAEAELARQYHGSASLEGAERGIPHALSAARRARAAGAPNNAIAMLGLARGLIPAEDLSTRARIEGELAVAEAEGGRLDDAVHTLESALSLLEAIGAAGETIAELVFRVVSTLEDMFAEPSAQLDSLIQRGLAALSATDTLAWARLKLVDSPRESVTSGPIQAFRWLGFDQRAVDIVRRDGSEDDYVRTLDRLEPCPVAELDELRSLTRGLRSPTARLTAMRVLLLGLTLHGGDALVAEPVCAELDALAIELSSRSSQAFANTCRAAMFAAAGDSASASMALSRARELSEQIPVEHGGWDPRVTRVVAELSTMHLDGDWSSLAELMRRQATSGPSRWRFLCGAIAADAFARAGMDDDAGELLGHIVPVLAATSPEEYAQNACVAFAAGAIWELQETELAAQLWPAARALIEARVGDWYMSSNELTVARLAAVLERDEESAEFFDRARGTLTARGQRPLRAILDYDEALARRLRRQPGSARLFVAAQAQFLELGMRPWSRRAAASKLRKAPSLPDGLTAREAEILRLVAQGMTNREIAAALVLSVHTVERHVQNAYRKIDVRNRADAAAYTVRTIL